MGEYSRISVSLGIIESDKKLRRKSDNSAGDYIIHNAPQGVGGGGQGKVEFRGTGTSRGPFIKHLEVQRIRDNEGKPMNFLP